jgi:CelD/BcsL family acetyltransferase involved in cellulose biosynthesis
MKACIDYAPPSPAFWENYRELWENSVHASAFQSPEYLKFLAGLEADNLALYHCYDDEKLIGAVFFKRKKRIYQFLSDLKADYNFFILHKRCSDGEVRMFFNHLLQIVRKEKWALFLDKQPAWAVYYNDLLAAVKNSGLHCEFSKYSVSLSLETACPDEMEGVLNKQKLRQKLNRLKKLGEVQFEVLENDEDLEQWMDEFVESHIKRWEKTRTPSNLEKAGRRAFFFNCHKAWHKDGLLVRFSIKVTGKRICHLIALREKHSLLHYSTTFNPIYQKVSPGLIAIQLMRTWIVEHKISKLDFGDGAEPYKELFANKKAEINRIYLSGKNNLPFIIKAKLTKTVRANPVLHTFYLNRVKPWVSKFSFFGDDKLENNLYTVKE